MRSNNPADRGTHKQLLSIYMYGVCSLIIKGSWIWNFALKTHSLYRFRFCIDLEKESEKKEKKINFHYFTIFILSVLVSYSKKTSNATQAHATKTLNPHLRWPKLCFKYGVME